jgi:RNase H-fold protein (predicted Holliday junction resolvase)
MRRGQAILAINPGTRYMGIAVFQGSDLVDWGLKILEGKWSPDKLQKASRIVSRLIERYQPSTVALKKNHPSRSSPELEQLTLEIETVCRKYRIPVSSRTIDEIESVFIDGKASSATIAELVCANYPALSRLLDREHSSANTYYSRLFEAAALGLAVLKSLRQ